MGEHDGVRMRLAQFADIGGGELLMHHAAPAPRDNLDLGLGGDILGEVLVRNHDDALGAPSDSTTFTALAEVQQMSDAAFTAADVLT